MPVQTRELIDALSVLATDHNIRVTVKSSLKAAVIVGTTTFVGGVLLGPVGLAVGSTLGGLGSYAITRGTFKSAAVIIREDLTEAQRERLCQLIHEAFREFGREDLVKLLPLLTTSVSFQKLAMAKLVQFLTDEFQMQITD